MISREIENSIFDSRVRKLMNRAEDAKNRKNTHRCLLISMRMSSCENFVESLSMNWKLFDSQCSQTAIKCFINFNAMLRDTLSLRLLLSHSAIESEQHKAFRSGHILALNRRIWRMHLRENRFCGEPKEVFLWEITSAHAREKHGKFVG